MGCDCENSVVEVCNQDGVLLQDMDNATLGDGTRFYVENDAGGGDWTGYWVTLADIANYFSTTPWGAITAIWGLDVDDGDNLLANGRTVTYQNDTTAAIETIVIPDLRGRTVVMPDIPDALQTGVIATDQKTGWARSMLQTEQMPAHGHSLTDPGHGHSLEIGSGDSSPQTVSEAATNVDRTQNTAFSATGITIASAGSGNPHNNTQPSYGLNHFFFANRPGWSITGISGVAALIPLTNINFDENSLTDPNI